MFVIVLVYIIACGIVAARSAGRLTVFLDVPPGSVGQPDVRIEGSPIELEGMETAPNGRLKVTVRGKQPGHTDMTIHWPQQEDTEQLLTFRTGPMNFAIEDGTLNFSGCQGILILTSVMLFLLTLIVVMHFHWRLKHDFYSYRTAFTGGMAIYAVLISLLFLFVSRDWWRNDPQGTVHSILSFFSSAGHEFMYLTAPFLFFICLGLIISNLSLVRHEGLRPANLLAAVAAFLVIIGFAAAVAVDESFTSGSYEEYRLHALLTTGVSSCFVFMEAMLLGTMLCGVIAAKREPDYDRDFVIIHGCKIGKDGKPLPLLRGRIDRALAFAKKQKEKAGKEVIFIPSGGQGPDECISEGQCIADYLAAKGVPPERMLVEERSVSTQENMEFSKAIIDRKKRGANVAFSTTNYHVFRSGMLAKKAGLDAQGMGSKTKWYFWPNAFIREFAALLVTERKAMLPMLAMMVAFFMALTYISIQ
ncbi:MAG: YdcF family protein [Clostridia bacterium]|nr:YdcF family protein [Clostridia bacterium]